MWARQFALLTRRQYSLIHNMSLRQSLFFFCVNTTVNTTEEGMKACSELMTYKFAFDRLESRACAKPFIASSGKTSSLTTDRTLPAEVLVYIEAKHLIKYDN